VTRGPMADAARGRALGNATHMAERRFRLPESSLQALITKSAWVARTSANVYG
jgi:hypothetical protein